MTLDFVESAVRSSINVRKVAFAFSDFLLSCNGGLFAVLWYIVKIFARARGGASVQAFQIQVSA